MKKFWNWRTVSNSDEGKRELFLHGEIAESTWWGDEVTPKQFRDELNSGRGPVTVYINSPGGDCIAASQIYTMLTEYNGRVTILIDGIAASAASVVAMAGDEVIMAPTALIMIHNPLTMAWGNKEDMEKAIDILESFKASIINAYENKTGLSRAKISRLMDEETWMDANEAIALGFADKMLSREEMGTADDYAIGNMHFSMHAVAACMNKAIEAMIEAKKAEEKEEDPDEDDPEDPETEDPKPEEDPEEPDEDDPDEDDPDKDKDQKSAKKPNDDIDENIVNERSVDVLSARLDLKKYL